MSGGASGLGGHIYQQDYFAHRALASAVAQALGDASLRPIESFLIEGRTSDSSPASDSSPVWDLILRYAGSSVELRECKNTEITKQDRTIFYKRVRTEVHSGTAPDNLQIGWITDPQKQGNILDHFAGMDAVLDAGSGGVPGTPPERVDSAQSAVGEALYYLSHPDPFTGNETKTRPIPLAAAERLLHSFTVDPWTSDALREAVSNLVSSVFEKGTPTALIAYIRGHLTSAIHDTGVATDSLQGFFDKVGTLSVMVSVHGSFKKFLQEHSAAAPNSPIPVPIIWDQLAGRPRMEWNIAERLPAYSSRASHVIIAQQGVGKTVLSLQAFRQLGSEHEKHRVLRLDAALLKKKFLRNLLSFCNVLCGLGPTWLAIDGLDGINRSQYKTWQATIDRLVAIPNLTLLVTAREEVLEAGEWLQRLTTRLPALILKRLEPGQVSEAFRAAGLPEPKNESLLEVLRNPFLLSLYAMIATHADMPLETSGEVTAFLVVKAFWARRVCAPSEGHRIVGPKESSSKAKRRAAEYMAHRICEEMLVVKRSADDDTVEQGIQMLIHEGVLVSQGTFGVRWMHDWLREYALVDLLVSEIPTPGPRCLAERVAILGTVENRPDHVVRSAAVGGAKWIVAHAGDWGRVEDYLAALHERLPGAASDALAMLMEGPDRALRLMTLSGRLLLEAVHFAKSLRARQWAAQITTLPTETFVGPLGSDIHRVVTDFELEVVGNE